MYTGKMSIYFGHAVSYNLFIWIQQLLNSGQVINNDYGSSKPELLFRIDLSKRVYVGLSCNLVAKRKWNIRNT
jgi:hypothetical protein